MERRRVSKKRPLDDPSTTIARREILRGKPFLVSLYREWHEMIRERLPAGGGAVLELGAGAADCGQVIPEAISSDVFPAPGVGLVADGRILPLRDHSLRALVMTDVFHHIPDIVVFLREASRCLCPGGRLLMIEPWPTRWSAPIYKHVHHEPFNLRGGWSFESSGPLSGANGALPWIVFERDRERFNREFPELRVDEIRRMMPFAYLASGGFSTSLSAPDCTYRLLRALERALDRWSNQIGMFAFICVTKVAARLQSTE